MVVGGAAVACPEDVGYTRTSAIFLDGPDHDGGAVDRHGPADIIARHAVGGRQLGHLVVRGATIARAEDICRAYVACAVAEGSDD